MPISIPSLLGEEEESGEEPWGDNGRRMEKIRAAWAREGGKRNGRESGGKGKGGDEKEGEGEGVTREE